ncbi:MAG: PIG-L deacetylase family protein [Acidimicrobiia bacterium]
MRRTLRSAEGLGREAWRRHLLARAVDVTERAATTSCLVLAPHPDDETLGCGATIARKRAAGTPVRVLFAADGRTSHRSAVVGPDELATIRAGEALAACEVLGVGPADVVQLGLPDETLGARRAELAEALAAELDAHPPDEVRLPSGRDWHPDHRALRAALGDVLRGRRRPPQVREHPVWLWVHGPWDSSPDGPWVPLRPASLLGYARRSAWATAEAVSTAGFLDLKRRALLAHRSQTSNLTGEAGWATFDAAFVAAFMLPVELSFPAAAG